jgi:hypothetical protein
LFIVADVAEQRARVKAQFRHADCCDNLRHFSSWPGQLRDGDAL